MFGAGYDEAYSAHADAQVQKHPSLLSRWGTHSQEALEEQWRKLRKSTPQGLWGKIKKEDDGQTTHHMFGHAREDAIHWLHVMEDTALHGFHQQQKPAVAGAVPPLAELPMEHVHQEVPAQVVMAGGEAETKEPVAPEHHISEDLDEHDAPDDSEHRSSASPSSDAVTVSSEPQSAASEPPSSASSSVDATHIPLDSAEHAKHEAAADEPVFH